MRSRLRINNFLLIALLFLVAGCATIYNPATQRNELILIDTASEISLGRDMDRQMQRKIKVSADLQLQTRLNTIGYKLAASSDRQDLLYYFRVANDEELNAFALPGGFVYVNSGLMQRATDDELASVLAHEIGHIAARHSVKKLQAAMGYNILINLALGISGNASLGRAMDIVFNLVNLGYSRQDEFLADRLAVKYSKKAGFDPYGMVTFFKKLAEEQRRKGPSFRIVFLSSHPPIEERIKNVEKEIIHVSSIPQTSPERKVNHDN
ncbi:MAG: M48 family metalloprotease [Candidatus Omnitrophica bacterium]|nr:M48 family metalloprotease [Candidatus Omnitrophota bacterium]